MPGSRVQDTSVGNWPRTPTEQTVPDAFENTGECVIERILAGMRELPLPSRREGMKTLGALCPGGTFRGHQNGAETTYIGGEQQHASKQYPVEVEIKVREEEELPRRLTNF